MKTKACIVVVCLLLVLAVQMPYKTTVTSETLSSVQTDGQNYPEALNDTLSQHLFDAESYPTFADSICIIQEEYLIKKDKTTYFIPYIMADVRDVWTAGMSTWGFWLNTLVVEEDGTTINENKKYNRSASAFAVEADPNTVIWEGAFSAPFKNVISIDLDKNEWAAMDEHVFFVGAATLDSSKTPNTDSVVSFKWESALAYGVGKKAPFVVEASSSYINNCKNTERSEEVEQFSQSGSVTFEGTMLFYKDRPYDVTLQNRAINSISSAIPAGEKLVVECHVGPQNNIYCIFDTESRSFGEHFTGNNFVWYNDSVETAVYAFGPEIYTYDGRLIKSYEFQENEYIYQMEFSDDHTKLNVEIMYIDGTTQIDIIGLQ